MMVKQVFEFDGVKDVVFSFWRKACTKGMVIAYGGRSPLV